MNVNRLANPIDHRSHGSLKYVRLNERTIQVWSPIAEGRLTKDEVESGSYYDCLVITSSH